MIIRYQDLVTLDLVGTDGTEHRVEDVFIDDKDLRVAYVVADVGSWLNERKAMVGIERFGEPDIANTEWPCTLDTDALAERPAPEEAGSPAGDKTLPDAMLVPVGSRISPRLLHGVVGHEDLPLGAKADPKGKIGEGACLRSVGEMLLNTDVLARDGNAGKLMGLIFDTADWRTRYVVIETGGEGLPQNQRVVEASRIVELNFAERKVKLDMPNEDVQKALDLHEVDGLEGKWYNKVLAYYGLQS